MILTTQITITLMGINILSFIPNPIQGRCLSLSKTDTQDFCQNNESFDKMDHNISNAYENDAKTTTISQISPKTNVKTDLNDTESCSSSTANNLQDQLISLAIENLLDLYGLNRKLSQSPKGINNSIRDVTRINNEDQDNIEDINKRIVKRSTRERKAPTYKENIEQNINSKHRISHGKHRKSFKY
ncbi:uncharacterized protein LOC135955478 [Calliphora vicina]|uniref:uncharacterized protein LOC135955478 n=1 Tax=Calliphora vicina TaxID=7373 RepID=UPI00325C30B1